MRLLRIYYNWLLVRLRIRKILPAFFITRIPVKECGEPLVVYSGVLMREAVAEMLAEARRNLPEGYEIIPVSGWRSAVEQDALQQDFCNRLKRKYPELTSADLVQQTKKWCADSGGHQTGGAVDVQLWYQGRIADCGTPYLSTSPDSETAEINRLSPEAMTNRRLLLQTMTEAGFVNYPAEWWHYCFGDQLYAAYHGEKYAFYGEIELYTPNSGENC